MDRFAAVATPQKRHLTFSKHPATLHVKLCMLVERFSATSVRAYKR